MLWSILEYHEILDIFIKSYIQIICIHAKTMQNKIKKKQNDCKSSGSGRTNFFSSYTFLYFLHVKP